MAEEHCGMKRECSHLANGFAYLHRQPDSARIFPAPGTLAAGPTYSADCVSAACYCGTRSARRPATASTAIAVVAIAATAKPPCAPKVPTAQPAAAAAPADPAALAEFSQTKAWVSTARWTAASASTEQRTRIRGIASPVNATPNPSANGEPATSKGRQPIASPAAATASCTRGAVRHWRSPYSQPASRL